MGGDEIIAAITKTNGGVWPVIVEVDGRQFRIAGVEPINNGYQICTVIKCGQEINKPAEA